MMCFKCSVHCQVHTFFSCIAREMGAVLGSVANFLCNIRENLEGFALIDIRLTSS